jgi:hypothetical protein
MIGKRRPRLEVRNFPVEIAQGVEAEEIGPLGVEHDFQQGPGHFRPGLVKDKVAQGECQALFAVAGEGAGPVGMAADDEFDASGGEPGGQGLFPGTGHRPELLAPVQEDEPGLVRFKPIEPV